MRNLLALAFLSLCSLVVSAGEIKPNAEFIKGPLQPLNKPDTEQSVLLGTRHFRPGRKSSCVTSQSKMEGFRLLVDGNASIDPLPLVAII